MTDEALTASNVSMKQESMISPVTSFFVPKIIHSPNSCSIRISLSGIDHRSVAQELTWVKLLVAMAKVIPGESKDEL